MKTRLYMKEWLERFFTITDVVSIMMLGMMADSLQIPTAYLLIPGTIAVISSILLMKYSRLGN